MDILHFAVVDSRNSDPLAAAAAANFMATCQENRPAVAAALAIANEAPGGVLDHDFLEIQQAHVSHDVAVALSRVVELFRWRGDEDIDFYPITKERLGQSPRGRRITVALGATTDPVEEGELSNRLRLLPFQQYVGSLAADVGDYMPRAV